MKFSKTLASVCAATVAVSSLATGTFAAPLADKLQNDGWKDPRSYSVKSTDITSDDLSAVNKVVFNMSVYDTNWGWNNGAVVVMTYATSDNWIQKSFGGTNAGCDVTFTDIGEFEVPVEFTPGPDGAFELMVTGVADDAFAVESIALYADAELVGTYGADGYVKPSTPTDPEEPVQPGETGEPEEPDDPSDPTPGDSDDPVDEPTDPDDPSDDPIPGETTSPSEPGDDNPSDVPSTPDEPGEDPSTPDNPSTGDDETPDEDLGDTVDIDLSGKGTTVIDSGKVRTNIVNQWGGEDANIADKAAFKNANKITVKFTVSDFTEPFTAWLAFADSNFGAKYWGEGDAANAGVKCVPVQVTGNGTYEITLELDKAIEGDIAVLAVCTDLEAAEGDAIPTIAIDGVTVTVDSDAEPGDSDKPAEPGDSDKPAEPGNSDKPAEPGDSDKPADDDNNNKPADDDNNNKPADDDNNKPADDDNNKPADDNKNPASPDTGVTAAVLPAALAAASLAVAGIVLKKRK